MVLFDSIQFRHWLIFAISMMLFIYFLFHITAGKNGLYASEQLTGQIEELKQEQKILQARKNNLNQKIRALNHPQQSPDFIDEMIRSKTGYVGKYDLIYPRKPL